MPPETCRVDLQRNKTSLHIVTSVGYSMEYYDARNNKYQVNIKPTLGLMSVNRILFVMEAVLVLHDGYIPEKVAQI